MFAKDIYLFYLFKKARSHYMEITRNLHTSLAGAVHPLKFLSNNTFRSINI